MRVEEITLAVSPFHTSHLNQEQIDILTCQVESFTENGESTECSKSVQTQAVVVLEDDTEVQELTVVPKAEMKDKEVKSN